MNLVAEIDAWLESQDSATMTKEIREELEKWYGRSR